MWVRLSDSEIEKLQSEKEEKNKSLKRPLVIATCFGLLFMLLHYLGWRGGLRGYYVFAPQGNSPAKTLLIGALGFVIFLALALWHQKKGISFLDGDNALLRCNVCKEISPDNPSGLCGCGGKLEPSEFFSWEDEELRSNQKGD